MSRKLTYEESGYVPQGTPFRCGTCSHYRSEKNPYGEYGTCHYVEDYVNPHACCNLWERMESDHKPFKFVSGKDAEEILRGRPQEVVIHEKKKNNNVIINA